MRVLSIQDLSCMGKCSLTVALPILSAMGVQCCPVPTAKVATKHRLAAKKPGWIDFDAGSLLEQPAEDVLNDFVETVLAIASGKPVKAEGLTKTELAIFKDGVTL